MVDAMVKKLTQTDRDELVDLARTDTDALGGLYELYYERILRFCVHRLFNRTVAEDVTSAIFLDVARKIGGFKGNSEDGPVEEGAVWSFRTGSLVGHWNFLHSHGTPG